MLSSPALLALEDETLWPGVGFGAAGDSSGELDLIINTPLGQTAYDDSRAMRAAAVLHDIPLLTTLSAAQAAVNGISALRANSLQVRSLQQHYS